MKNILRLGALLCITSGALIQARSVDPKFSTDESGREYIQLVAQGSLCGSVKIVPILAERVKSIKLEAYLSVESLWSSERTETFRGSDTLSTIGKTYSFDWGGGRSSYEYRIYVKAVYDNGEEKTIPASQGVRLENIHNNDACVGTDYGALQMNAA